MSIRLKIGLGFAGLIIAMTGLVAFWGAHSLAISLEETDLEKLSMLRNQVLGSWATQRARLASQTREIAAALALILPEQQDHGQLLEATEKLRRHLSLDWLEILEDRQPVLFPGMTLLPVVIDPPGWPIRISQHSPLRHRSLLVCHEPIPGTSRIVITGQKPAASSVSPVFLWDDEGLLVGDPEVLSHATLRSWEHSPQTRQILSQDRLYRIRTEALTPAGPHLLSGYEASLVSLTRTGINDLMLQVALLEIAGLLLLGYFLVRRLFAPLDQLRHRMELVARGKWQKLPSVHNEATGSSDEVQAVAQAFNTMVQELSTAQDRLIEVQQQLLRREKLAALGRFSAGIAHEINNPLGTILVSAGLVKQAREDGESIELEDIEAIISETKRCRRIVESLLQYAHNRQPHLQRTSLGQLVASVSQDILTSHADRAIRLEMQGLADLELDCDPTGLEQVFRNLLKNSVEALVDAKDPCIRVTAVTAGGMVTLSVLDNGSGTKLDPDQIFEPLTTDKEMGTGLGLAISQAIVERHGGRIWLNRTPDGWTGLHVLLPAPSPLRPPTPGENPVEDSPGT